MLLYLASNQNIGLFDFLVKERGMVVKKLSGEFLLKQFVINDMRNISVGTTTKTKLHIIHNTCNTHFLLQRDVYTI